jgi:hypothetical protein
MVAMARSVRLSGNRIITRRVIADAEREAATAKHEAGERDV